MTTPDATLEERVALLEKRLDASERRNAHMVEAIADEMKRISDRIPLKDDEHG